MKIYTKEQIKEAIDIPYFLDVIEKGLIQYSNNQATLAPVSFLHFENRGDVHIKSGALQNDELYVVKVASGFYHNPALGLPSSNGLMMLFSQKTGALRAILLDEGELTDLRTALAGAICAKHLASNPVVKIGIIGTGTQAKQQLSHLHSVIACKEVLVWGRDAAKAAAFAQDPSLAAFNISLAKNIAEVTQNCNLIVTATASDAPLLFGHQIRPGTHITAVGADDKGKQELDASVFHKANLIVADSVSQCFQYGDLSYAKNIAHSSVIEIGAFLNTPQVRQEQWITVADLTGIAIEDLQIAKAVYSRLSQEVIA